MRTYDSAWPGADPAAWVVSSGGDAPASWTVLEDCLLSACRIVNGLVHGRLDTRPLVPTTVRLESGERVLAAGPAELYSWRALGDGSYVHEGMQVFGGLGFLLLSVLGSALVNAIRRRQAEADAESRWVAEEGAMATITDRRVCFRGPDTALDVGWDALDMVELVASDVVELSFDDIRHGDYRTLRVRSEWAALMFAIAAHTAFPAHPRLLSGGWLPPGFEERCAAIGRWCPSVR